MPTTSFFRDSPLLDIAFDDCIPPMNTIIVIQNPGIRAHLTEGVVHQIYPTASRLGTVLLSEPIDLIDVFRKYGRPVEYLQLRLDKRIKNSLASLQSNGIFKHQAVRIAITVQNHPLDLILESVMFHGISTLNKYCDVDEFGARRRRGRGRRRKLLRAGRRRCRSG